MSKIARRAEIKDIAKIMAILEQNLIANKSPSEKLLLETSGFLIHDFRQDEPQKAIEDNHHHIVFVVTEDAEVIGYAFSDDLKHLNTHWIDENRIPEAVKNIFANEKFFILCKDCPGDAVRHLSF